MSEFLRVALIGLNQTPLDWTGNVSRIREGRDRARALGASLMCFPELAVSGYGCEDLFLHPDTARRSLANVSALARETGAEILLVGLPLMVADKLYNAVAILNQGAIRGFVLKSHLAREGIHYEPRWFWSWPVGTTGHVDWEGHSVPIGTLMCATQDLNFAMEICEDAWVSPDLRPCRYLSDAQWIFHSSASHFSMGKADTRERLVQTSSRLFGVGYTYCNLVGCESGRAIYDGEQLIALDGEIINRSDRLVLQDVHILMHDLPYIAQEPLPQALRLQITKSSNLPPLPPPNRERQHPSAEAEMARAATLALLDYMRKSRARGFTLSLSGGVDSSTVAVLVSFLARRVLTELTLDERLQKLNYLGLDLDTDNPGSLVHGLLTTVYQATAHSGEVTRFAAATLAHAIGACHYEMDINGLVEEYKEKIGALLGRPLTWNQDDLALQNIQARVRGPGVWMLANIRGSLLLSTSNRSEVAVGYATMDGDTCGGLAPIAGLDKTFLRQWLRHMETEGLPGFPAIPELVYVNQQQPTAELRPPSSTQTDEQDLMPYSVLDALEDALIAQRQTPLEAFQQVQGQFGTAYSSAELRQWTRRFCRMFATSQWKRERYAPAFHLDDRNLDPKTWARYPILSGQFAQELEELDQAP